MSAERQALGPLVLFSTAYASVHGVETDLAVGQLSAYCSKVWYFGNNNRNVILLQRDHVFINNNQNARLHVSTTALQYEAGTETTTGIFPEPNQLIKMGRSNKTIRI
jgi:hypothetical protein